MDWEAEDLSDGTLIARDDIARLRAALLVLPTSMREAISLAYFEDLSRAEIAERMGVTPQVVSEFIVKGALLLADALLGPPTGQGDEPRDTHSRNCQIVRSRALLSDPFPLPNVIDS